jgi:predicted acylesterase/phospholipase RssA
VLQAYEALGWRCEEYRGCSGGGLVAAFASAGKLFWFANLLRQITSKDLFRSAHLWGLWKGYRYNLTPLYELCARSGAWDFVVETPCRLVLYDLHLQRVVRHKLDPGTRLGEHRDAIFGTMAVPGIFPPTNAGRWVDGGVTEAVPTIEPLAVQVQSPWVVSIAMAFALTPRPVPTNLKDILLATIDGLSAEVVMNDLVEARRYSIHRLHALPSPETLSSFDFTPDVSKALIEAGRADVQAQMTALDRRRARTAARLGPNFGE